MGLTLYPKRRMSRMVRNGEYEEALRFGRSLEEKMSGDHDFMFIMGSTYCIVEDHRNALPYLDRALGLEPGDVEALKLKTNAHLALGQKDEALSCVSRVLEHSPRDEEALDLLDRLDG